MSESSPVEYWGERDSFHSLIISGKHTYDEWHMVPTSRPVVNPPAVKTNLVELPGVDSISDNLDFSELLMGRVAYGRRTGSWEFLLRPGTNWPKVYYSLLDYLHGVVHQVILEDDPQYYYTGRLKINQWKSDSNFSLITIDYDFDPYKKARLASDDHEWNWDDELSQDIQYGTFVVSGSVVRNFVYNGAVSVVPYIYCTETCGVEFKGQRYTLVPGVNHNNNLLLTTGDNIMEFSGFATITVRYREAKL